MAEGLSVAAERELSRGQHGTAWSLYGDAARHELAALREISPDKVRTYSAIALSAAAMLFKAKRYADCADEARAALDAPVLEEYARTELEELLSEATTVLLTRRAVAGIATAGLRFPGFHGILKMNFAAMLKDPVAYPRQWKTDESFRVATMHHAGVGWHLRFELREQLTVHALELAGAGGAAARAHRINEPMLIQ